MNEEVDPTIGAAMPHILAGCLLGLMIGCPIGGLGSVALALLREPGVFFSVGFGFLGVLYVPLIGGVSGSVLGCIIGGVVAGREVSRQHSQ